MKFIRFFFLLFLTLIIWLAVRQYFFCPQFLFKKGVPFSGNQLYNPYSEITSGDWIKCNFHAHTNAWNGLMNGKGTVADVWRNYDSLGYTVHCVSDYQKINESFNDQQNYVSAYEHGYNIQQIHQLVLGDHEVNWLDYIFPQTLSNKQWILKKLSDNSDNVVIINHPKRRKSYKEDELKYLNNYNGLEVLRRISLSIAHWDTALSAGKPVFIIGNDDTHNATVLKTIGLYCTWVNVPAVNSKNILTALKRGQSYGMKIADNPSETINERINRIKYKLPKLKKFSLLHDTIELSITAPAKQIQFIGQHGKILSQLSNTTEASYIFGQQDHYIRTVITFVDDTEIFLNPVFRYSGSPFSGLTAPVINRNKTLLFYISGLILLAIWSFIVIYILFGKFIKTVRR